MTHRTKIAALGILPLLLALSACNSTDDGTNRESTEPQATGGASQQSGVGGQSSRASSAAEGGKSNSSSNSNGGTSSLGKQTVLSEEVPASLTQALERAKSMDAGGITEAYPVPATKKVSYDPTTATGMDLIQKSSLSLNESELAVLGENGLVISARHQFPSFSYGYKNIYFEHLPVYVSADSILEAVHRTFDSLLASMEQQVLSVELSTLLSAMRQRIASSTTDDKTKQDADLYLAVAEGLLQDPSLAKPLTAPLTTAQTLISLAQKAEGHSEVSLFGSTRDEDFSQFTPRGHYTRTPQLGRYFKAMMWLGRVDLRIVETQDDGSQLFRRQQFNTAVALRELLGESEMKLWSHIDDTIGAYVGEHDSMTPKTLGELMTALKISTASDALALSDDQIVSELQRGDFGAQRIASRLIVNNTPDGKTLPLDRSFLLFGQRYTVDSHTFVNVTYDRVPGRLMPKPLDAAFAAFGNNSALPLLSGEFSNAGYVQGLAKSRALVDAHEAAYWEGSIYTRWLSSLRSLSPSSSTDLPSVANTDAWQRRMLSTQLGSWAELRHDTILYVKQSYTTGIACEFPDAYVDPYPEFYAKLGGLAREIEAISNSLPESASTLKTSTQSWLSNFTAVTANLQKMAENQRTGAPHSAELIDFINDAVKWDEQAICGGVTRSNYAGWYLKLFLNPVAGIEANPVVADVHTQSTDEGGNDVGRILHVGTGLPRLMVVTVETCNGPRAYTGLAFSYGELITDNWLRLTDEQWTKEIAAKPFPDAAWMSPVIAK